MSAVCPALRIDWQGIEAIAFDLDGTLVDTLGDFHAALIGMLQTLALPSVSAADVASYIGQGTDHLVRQVLAQVLRQAGPADAAEAALAAQVEAWFERARDHYLARYAELNGRHARVYPGVREGLQALQRQGLPLACLTNKPEALARVLLQHKALDGFFVQLTGGDSYAERKPHPLPLLKTAAALGVTPAAMLMVGDSINDSQAARAAHSPCVLVPYGYSHGLDIQAIDADGVVPDLAVLAALRADALAQS